MATMVERLTARAQMDEEVATSLLSSAASFVLGLTNQTELNDALETLVVELALSAFNRMGSEGITSESMAGTSVSYETDLTPAQWQVIHQHTRMRGWD